MVIGEFPLWRNDGKISIKYPNKLLKKAVTQLRNDIDKKKLVLRESHCLCGNEQTESDICISEKDRYGLPIPQIMCSKCGIIRSALVFDEDSNAKFYKNYYRSIYNSGISKDSFWKSQCKKGDRLLNLFRQHVDYNKIQTVAEVGCGAGGILWAFKNTGKQVEGFDFDIEYLNYGTDKGLCLHFGDFEVEAKHNYDLVILSHVLEHFLNPIESIKKIIAKVNPNKFIIVEVPGILNIPNSYYNPITYFQNAHIYNFYYEFLKVFFEKQGLKVIYGDEYCDFILQKTDNYLISSTTIYESILEKYPKMIKDCILNTQHAWKYRYFRPTIMYHELWALKHKLGL